MSKQPSHNLKVIPSPELTHKPMDIHKKMPKPRKRRYTNKWNLKFLEERPFDDWPFIPRERGFNTQYDEEDFFERNFSRRPSRRNEIIRKFSEKNLGGSKDMALRRAWVNCLTRSTESDQGITARLGPAELTEFLSSQRFGSTSKTGSYRHLLHIPHPDREYILSLIRTAWNHQIEPIGDGIHKYLDGQASVQAQINHIGFKILVLELHLPYLLLRSTAGAKPNTHTSVDTDRLWDDLSFLGIAPCPSEAAGQYVIHEVQTSVIICVWDFTKWAAYAFTNSTLDDESEGDDSNEEPHSDPRSPDLEDNMEDEGPSEEEPMQKDMVASNGDSLVLGADNPTWCPLKYFIRIVEARYRTVLDEWAYIVEAITPSIKQKNTKLRHTLSRGKEIRAFAAAREMLSWTVAAMTFLANLRDKISAANQAWKRFDDCDGHRNYFSELKDHNIDLTLDVIRASVANLTRLKEKLDALYALCKGTLHLIGLYASQESTHLNRESIAFSREANRYSCEANRVNLDSHRLTHGMNLNSAIALSTNQIMIPLAAVAALFSIEEDIFGFEKHAASFLAATIILYVVMRITSMITFLLRKFVPARLKLALLVLGQLDRLETKQLDQDHVGSY